MNYKEILAYQPILSTKIITLVEELQAGSLTKEQFHNRKAYAKRKGNLVLVLEYSIAFEIVNSLKSKEAVLGSLYQRRV